MRSRRPGTIGPGMSKAVSTLAGSFRKPPEAVLSFSLHVYTRVSCSPQRCSKERVLMLRECPESQEDTEGPDVSDNEIKNNQPH